MAFDTFNLKYGDKVVVDVVEIENCTNVWFDKKDLSTTTVITEEYFDCYHKTGSRVKWLECKMSLFFFKKCLNHAKAWQNVLKSIEVREKYEDIQKQ